MDIQKVKVAIYIRVSTKWQIDKDSLQVQKKELAGYCVYVMGTTDYEIFEDPGYSAKNTDRPAYQQMMSRLRTGEFSHLLVWKIDRISRNLLDFSGMYSELKSLGVVFISKNEQFDTSTAIGEAMLKIILVFAELERKMTAERVSAVMLSRADTGKWNGGRVPYGYEHDKEEDKFYLSPVEAPIAKQVFSEYIRRKSIISVCQMLNDSQIRPREGREWNAVAIHKMLRSEFYIGNYVYNKRTPEHGERDESEWVRVENHHIPLIDRSDFIAVQKTLQRYRESGRGQCKKTTCNPHIFAGLLVCYYCNSNMYSTVGKKLADGTRTSVYGCSRRRKSKDECSQKFTTDNELGDFVFNFVSNVIRLDGKVSESTSLPALEKKLLRGDFFGRVGGIEKTSLITLKNAVLEGFTNPYEQITNRKDDDEKQALIATQRKNENALNRLKTLYLYSDSNLPETEYIIERGKIQKQLDDTNKKIAEIEKKESTLGTSSLQEKAAYYIMTKNLTETRYFDFKKCHTEVGDKVMRDFLHSILSRITVKDGVPVEIEFKNGIVITFMPKEE